VFGIFDKAGASPLGVFKHGWTVVFGCAFSYAFGVSLTHT
jgi:hypothetical protein